MRCGLALSGEIGGQDNLLHFSLVGRYGQPGCVFGNHPVKQLLQPDIVRANAIKRTELAHQHEVKAFVRQRALKRCLIGWGFNHAQFAAVALGIGAGAAYIELSQRIAQIAMPDAAHGMLQCFSDLQRSTFVMLQQMKRHAGG